MCQPVVSGTGMQAGGLQTHRGFIADKGKLASVFLNSGQGIREHYQWAGEGKGMASWEDSPGI